jgi:exodeoxyribonuclease VII large subunit
VQDRTWSVAELAGDITRLVGAAFPGEVWVRGQIRSLSRHRSGHVYLDLAEPAPDGQPPQALLGVVLFADDKAQVNATLKQIGAVRMADGIEVRIRCRVRFFARQGRLQLRMTAIDPAYTLGRLAEDRERLLTVLRAEGLVDRNRGLVMPRVPLRVGIVTSVGSAAWHDVLHELESSGHGFHVVAADARTQGPTTGRSVAAGIRAVSERGVDVVVVVRGGGSRTDLSPFDGEAIARAVALAPVPVLTGIGHEVDSSVADLVAHTACKTPTACGSLLVTRVRDHMAATDATWDAIRRRASHRLDVAEEQLRAAARRTARATQVAVEAHERRLAVATDRLATRSSALLDAAAGRVETAAVRVRAHDPAVALARGWSITRDGSGRLVRSVDDVAAGDQLVTVLADGTVTSRTERTESTRGDEHDDRPDR